MIITGANNSGKSFYLRTIAVLQVMAQIGCFVPASYAMIRICDQLFSRIGSDNATNNMESSFTAEMKEVAFVLKHKTPTALIILDELCRGTSSHEAVDICFTICQQLLQISAFTLFATHYKELCQLESIYNNCSNFCFVTKYEEIATDTVAKKILNDHKLKKGVAKGSRYGLRLAATMNFSTNVISHAYSIADRLDSVLSGSIDNSVCPSFTSSIRDDVDEKVNKVYDEITLISRHGGCSTDKVRLLMSLRARHGAQLKELLPQKAQLRLSHESRKIEDKSPSTALSELSAPSVIRLPYLGICSNSTHTTGRLVNLSSEPGQPNGQSLWDTAHPLAATGKTPPSEVLSTKPVSEITPSLFLSSTSDKDTYRSSYSMRFPKSDTTSSLFDASNKLVNYSISSIDLSGSIMYNPHSDIATAINPMYRTSTRKSRDPQSPTRSLLLHHKLHNHYNDDSDRDSDIPFNFVAPMDSEVNPLESIFETSNSRPEEMVNKTYLSGMCAEESLRNLDANSEDDADAVSVCPKNSFSKDGLHGPGLGQRRKLPMSCHIPNKEPEEHCLPAVSTFEKPHSGLSAEDPAVRNQTTSSLSATLQSVSSGQAAINRNLLNCAEAEPNDSNNAHCLIVLNKSHRSLTGSASASKHEHSKHKDVSVCYSIDRVANTKPVKNNSFKITQDEQVINIADISPILGAHSSLNSGLDPSTQKLINITPSSEYEGACVKPTVDDGTGSDSLAQVRVSATLNKTMRGKKAFEDHKGQIKPTSVSSLSARGCRLASNSEIGGDGGSSNRAQNLDTMLTNQCDAVELSTSDSCAHTTMSAPKWDDRVLAGSVRTTDLSEADSESHYSKNKSVTFGEDEIIPPARAGRSLPSKKKQKLERNECMSMSILRISDDSHKVCMQRAENTLIVPEAQENIEPSSEENATRMGLLDELLSINQTSKDEPCSSTYNCYSTIKIEPK